MEQPAEKKVIHVHSEVNSIADALLYYTSRASNGPAKALYGSLGFVRVGCRRGYYLSPKEDGEILRKEWDL